MAIFFLVYVEKVSWSPSEGGVGGGALSGYLLDASQPAALLCCLQYIDTSAKKQKAKKAKSNKTKTKHKSKKAKSKKNE